jgi:hypothetical protein
MRLGCFFHKHPALTPYREVPCGCGECERVYLAAQCLSCCQMVFAADSLTPSLAVRRGLEQRREQALAYLGERWVLHREHDVNRALAGIEKATEGERCQS